MANAFAHRLFTRGHVKYVRFHGDRAAEWNGDARDGFLDGWAAAGKKQVSQSTVFRNTPWRLFSGPFSLAKNEGAISSVYMLGEPAN